MLSEEVKAEGERGLLPIQAPLSDAGVFSWEGCGLNPTPINFRTAE